jgi:hypothetical protein
MKKVLVAGALLLSLTAVNAQDLSLSVVKGPTFKQSYKPFRVDISTGAALPQGSGAKGGVMFSVEPKYTFLGMFSVGLRMEAALMARGYVSSDGSTSSGNVMGSASYLATYDYYLTKVIFKPFVGAGTGIYNLASASFSDNSQNTTVAASGASSKVGGMVRSGFEFHHFRFAVEYNFIGSTNQTITDNNTGAKVGTATTKNGYCSIKIGILLGGGRK